MFDYVAPQVFWPTAVLLWLVVSLVVGIAIGKVIRWCDSEGERFQQRDRVAESKRRIARNGFKSRIGAR
jgi:hypothetical protein